MNIFNQGDLSNKKIVALYDNRQAIYGTDGVLFTCDTDGNIYRAIETMANIPTGSLLSDNTKWLKVDLISNQSLFNADLGSVKKGLRVVKGADIKLDIESGTLKVYDSVKMLYVNYIFPALSDATFDYIEADGTITDANQSEIDTENYIKNGAKTLLGRNTYASFQKFYIALDGRIRAIRGQVQYRSLARASYEHIDEVINDLSALGYYYIGGLLLTKNCSALDSKRCRSVYASKLGESHVGASGGSLSLIKTPQADIASIQAIEEPETGEIRQDLSELPKVVLWAFNTESTTGKSADDGTTGFWNKIEAETSRKLESKTADFSTVPNYDYNVDCSGGDITATIPNVTTDTKGKTFSVRKTDNTSSYISCAYGGVEIAKIWAEKECLDFIYTDSGVEILSDYDGKKLQVDHSAVGRIVFQVENQALGVYALNGQTISDFLLAQHINNNSDKYNNFSVSGSNVTLPDMQGDILYGGGANDLDTKTGTVVDQAVLRHNHTFGNHNASGNSPSPQRGGGTNGSTTVSNTGGDYNRVQGRTAQLCIVGTSYIKLDINSTLATPITVTFTGQTVNGGDSNVTIFEGISYHVVRVDLGANREIDTVTNAVILDGRLGLIGLQRVIGGGDFTVDIVDKAVPKKWMFESFSDNVAISNSWQNIKTWTEFNKQSGEVLELSYRLSGRNDDSGWGGFYLGIAYTIDSGTNWHWLFDSGFDGAMTSGGDTINSISGSFIVDIQEIIDSDKIQFRYASRTYTGDGNINDNHGINNGNNGNNYSRTNISLKVIQ